MSKNNFYSDDNLSLNLLSSTKTSDHLNFGDTITPQLVSFDNALNLNSNSLAELEIISQQAIEQTYDYLNEFARDSDWETEIKDIFGTSYSVEAVNNIINNFSASDFSSLPPIKIVSGQNLQGSNGGYDDINGLIYLSSDFIFGNEDNPNAIVKVILEEVGHHIDARINQKDTLGDEGAAFSSIVLGSGLQNGLFDEDDFNIITIDGKEILIEQSDSDLAGNNLS
ncbi:MAG: hypothetical protein ACFCAD_17335 [Pleurocapsa sp.]